MSMTVPGSGNAGMKNQCANFQGASTTEEIQLNAVADIDKLKVLWKKGKC